MGEIFLRVIILMKELCCGGLQEVEHYQIREVLRCMVSCLVKNSFSLAGVVVVIDFGMMRRFVGSVKDFEICN